MKHLCAISNACIRYSSKLYTRVHIIRANKLDLRLACRSSLDILSGPVFSMRWILLALSTARLT